MPDQPKIELTREEFEEALVSAMQKAFSAEDPEQKQRFINVSRVPLICQAIVGIDTRLKGIEDNQKWVTRLIVGAVLAALLGLVLIRAS